MFDRHKKTALVTGASSGMGNAIALQLIADGFQVYAAARQVDKMKDLAQFGAKILRMDLSHAPTATHLTRRKHTHLIRDVELHDGVVVVNCR